MAALYLHYEEASPEFTMKLPLAAGPSAAEALLQFAAAYAKKTGRTLQVSALRMSTERGRTLEPTAVLPCGIPSGSDLFVGGAQPVLAPGAKDAPVYAKEGSKVAASQGKMGENSYYYSVGKNRGEDAAALRPDLRAISVAPSAPKEDTLSSYSLSDESGIVKLQLPMAGAGALASGAVVVSFRDRSFDLRVHAGSKLLRLHVPILLEEIDQHRCTVKKLAGKLVLSLAKRDASKSWWELRKTKGVGETDYHLIKPDAGEEVVVTV